MNGGFFSRIAITHCRNSSRDPTPDPIQTRVTCIRKSQRQRWAKAKTILLPAPLDGRHAKRDAFFLQLRFILNPAVEHTSFLTQ